MILVTHRHGPVFALNPDLVERVDCTPDTVVTMTTGTQHAIAESIPEFIARVREYRASLLAQAQTVHTPPNDPQAGDPCRIPAGDRATTRTPGQVLALHRGEDPR